MLGLRLLTGRGKQNDVHNRTELEQIISQPAEGVRSRELSRIPGRSLSCAKRIGVRSTTKPSYDERQSEL